MKKNKNDKIWRFLEIFTKIYKRLKTKKGKMTIVFWPSDYCRKWPKKFKKIFGVCFRYTLHELQKILWKKPKMTKFDDFWKFSSKQKILVVKNRVFWQKFFFWNFCKSVGNRQNEKKIIKIKSSSTININPYPKYDHSINSRETMLVWTTTVFSDP